MTPPASTSNARLRWQCRRGMRELDLLLLRYLESEYPTVTRGEQQGFERLLELTDPELLGYLLHGERPADQELAHVIERVRNLLS
ncbi:MAG: succinate dehydrogenase assembly factor 2 [Steroidobacteraceae bacterium]